MSSDFYDQLAPFYHLLYGDWEAAVRTQGEALARLLHMRGVAGLKTCRSEWRSGWAGFSAWPSGAFTRCAARGEN
jgi:hypothetical protein